MTTRSLLEYGSDKSILLSLSDHFSSDKSIPLSLPDHFGSDKSMPSSLQDHFGSDKIDVIGNENFKSIPFFVVATDHFRIGGSSFETG